MSFLKIQKKLLIRNIWARTGTLSEFDPIEKYKHSA